jgi:hypothetical protein
MSGDLFVYVLMALNAGASLWYALEGQFVKSFYWLCVIGLNFCILRLK